MSMQTAPLAVSEETLVEMVSSIWPVFFETEAIPVPVEPIDSGITAAISIAGGCSATLVVSMDDDLAHRSAAQLLAMTVEELDDECLFDAIGEVANVVGGNVKGMFDDDDGALTLSLPVVSRTNQSVVGSSVIAAVGFIVDGSNMVWRLHEPNQPAA